MPCAASDGARRVAARHERRHARHVARLRLLLRHFAARACRGSAAPAHRPADCPSPVMSRPVIVSSFQAADPQQDAPAPNEQPDRAHRAGDRVPVPAVARRRRVRIIVIVAMQERHDDVRLTRDGPTGTRVSTIHGSAVAGGAVYFMATPPGWRAIVNLCIRCRRVGWPGANSCRVDIQSMPIAAAPSSRMESWPATQM